MKKGFYLSGLLAGCFLLLTIGAQATVPTITTNPSPDTACSGSIAKFFVTANDTPGSSTINYSWQVSTDGVTWSAVSDVAPYANSTTDTLYVTASMALGGYQFRSIVANTDSSDTSGAGMLTVDTLNPGVIAGSPTMCVGALNILTDAAVGGVWGHTNTAADALTPTGQVTGLAQGFDTVMYTVTNVCGMRSALLLLEVDTVAMPQPISGPTTTCVGHIIDLTDANVLGTAVWSTLNPSIATVTGAGAVTGLSHGLDTVVYVFTNGCGTVRDSIGIHVDTVLSAGIISGLTEVCAGSWIHLTDAVTGGVWLSSSANTIVDDLGNVTGVSQGTSTITYLLSNGCGASVAIYSVTVDAPAGAILGSDSVGVGAHIVLTDGTPGGTFAIADTTIAKMDSAGVLGVSPGVTTVTYTVTNVCGTSSATLTLYVGNRPLASVIAGPDSVCRGSSITLTNTFGGGVWASANTGVATIDSNSGTVTGMATGTVIISYVIHNGFGMDTVYRNFEVDSLPIVAISGPSVVALSQNYIFLGVPCCGTWTQSQDSMGSFVSYGVIGDTVVDSMRYPSASFASYVVVRAMHDVITYTVSNGCGTRSNTFTIDLAGSNFVQNVNGGNEKMNLYPNPNQGSFTLSLTSGTNEQASVVITNIVGEKVKELSVPTNASTEIKLDEPAGVYFLNVNTSNGSHTAKISIAR